MPEGCPRAAADSRATPPPPPGLRNEYFISPGQPGWPTPSTTGGGAAAGWGAAVAHSPARSGASEAPTPGSHGRSTPAAERSEPLFESPERRAAPAPFSPRELPQGRPPAPPTDRSAAGDLPAPAPDQADSPSASGRRDVASEREVCDAQKEESSSEGSFSAYGPASPAASASAGPYAVDHEPPAPRGLSKATMMQCAAAGASPPSSGTEAAAAEPGLTAGADPAPPALSPVKASAGAYSATPAEVPAGAYAFPTAEVPGAGVFATAQGHGEHHRAAELECGRYPETHFSLATRRVQSEEYADEAAAGRGRTAHGSAVNAPQSSGAWPRPEAALLQCSTQEELPTHIARAALQGREALQAAGQSGAVFRKQHRGANEQLKEHAARTAADRDALTRQLERGNTLLRAKDEHISELRRECEGAATAQQQLGHVQWLLQRAEARANAAESQRSQLLGQVEQLQSDLERERAQPRNEAALQQRDQALERLRRQLAERDGQLAERDGQLAERDGQLAERDGQLAERDQELREARLALSQREREGAAARAETTRAQRQAQAAQAEVVRLAQDMQNAAHLYEMQLRLARNEMMQLRLDVGLESAREGARECAAVLTGGEEQRRPAGGAAPGWAL